MMSTRLFGIQSKKKKILLLYNFYAIIIYIKVHSLEYMKRGSMIRKILGVLVIIGGIVVGVYVDIWLLLVGGIKEIVAGVTATPMNGDQIAWGIVRAVVFDGLGLILAWVCIVVGIMLLTGVAPKMRRTKKRSHY